MHRHRLDPVALVFGALFLVLGLAYAVTRWSWIDGGGGWILGVVLIALGTAGVVTATRRRDDDPTPT